MFWIFIGLVFNLSSAFEKPTICQNNKQPVKHFRRLVLSFNAYIQLLLSYIKNANQELAS